MSKRRIVQLDSFHPQNCVDPRLDWHRVHAILDLVQDDEIIDSLQSMEESDIAQHSDHDSGSEAEMISVPDQYIDCKEGYMSKDGNVFSKSAKLGSNTKIESFKLEIGSRALKYHTAKNMWQQYFSDDILDLIVDSTNENIANIKNSEPISITELKAVIGILYYHGVVRSTHPNRKELWDDNFGATVIKKCMTLQRFEFLLKNLRFESENVEDILNYDVMKKMRKVFEIFAHNCRTVNQIGNSAVVDETIVPVQGPCPFRYSSKNKNIDTGFKMIVVADPNNFYVSNLEIVTDTIQLPEDIIKRVLQHLANTGRTIFMDSWFTSLSLINQLEKEYHLYTIAALNPNDSLIPPLFLSHQRPSNSFMTAFINSNITLTSFVNNKRKVINILSNNPKYYKKALLKHVSPVSAYKKSQSAVEVLDVLSHYYTTKQSSNNWTLTLFFTLLDIAAINTQVIWCRNIGTILQRRLFLKSLALQLMKEITVQNVLSNKTQPRNSELFNNYNFDESYLTRRHRCYLCTSKRNRKSRVHCRRCGRAICGEHQIHFCCKCAS